MMSYELQEISDEVIGVHIEVFQTGFGCEIGRAHV